MKTQFNNLAFNKTAIVELNATQMRQTDSGITPAILYGAAISSNFCASVVLGAATYAITQL